MSVIASNPTPLSATTASILFQVSLSATAYYTGMPALLAHLEYIAVAHQTPLVTQVVQTACMNHPMQTSAQHCDHAAV